MKYGYARVSSKGQNLSRQLAVLEPLCDEVVTETESGKTIDRPELKRLMASLRSGDELTVKSIDRLARNTKELLQLIDSLIEKAVKVTFIDNNQTFDNSPSSRLILTMMGAVAEFERGIIAARRDEGIELAKEKGKYKGKQANKELHAKVLRLLEAGNNTIEEIAKIAECGVATVYRIKKTMNN
ncbi:recombinase family protein [Yersinia mollaretii]|uniref:recombinase family protein n=1 Tax=Yersinia mollaretii TaxID=33060 RepID=UPI001427D008|nr:recombinase family protein [Yersinia mollaretii]MDA5534295.1 recombinase family protein [Yersinia mollaretii]NIL02223.1 recombinase family protein [Yersinia mollaretii]